MQKISTVETKNRGIRSFIVLSIWVLKIIARILDETFIKRY